MTDLIIVSDSTNNNHREAAPNSATAVPANQSQPMVSLDPGGQATPLSYDVPEPMSYSGRNYITLDLPADAFATPTVDLVQALGLAVPASPPTKSAAIVQAALLDVPADEAGDATAGAETMTTSDGNAGSGTTAPNNRQPPIAAGEPFPVAYTADGLTALRSLSLASAAATILPTTDGAVITEPPEPPAIDVAIDTPANSSSASGSSQGVTVQVSGHWGGSNFLGDPTIVLSADGGAPTGVSFDARTWHAAVTFTTGGMHVLKVSANVNGASWRGHTMTASDSASVQINVTLGSGVTPPPVLPTVTVTSPHPNQTFQAPAGSATVAITGQASLTPPADLRVTATDLATGRATSIDLPAGGAFTLDFTLTGLGAHTVQVVATAGAATSPAQLIPVIFSPRQPAIRVTNKLMIVETLNLTSYLGSYGAGRCLKTFSLLAGETTTISIKSYSSRTDTTKLSDSVLDSSSTDAETDFHDTVTAEQTDKQATDQSTKFGVSGSASASWGFGTASLTASYSGATNAAREEAVKNVSNATRSHAMKASANRSVTINTESASTLTTTQEDSTIRQITNRNVSRTLNYVFRQMNQEHVVLYHLTNARVAYYTEDIPLDATGKPEIGDDGKPKIIPTYQEVSLPELGSLLEQILNPLTCSPDKVNKAVTNALSAIPDYTDQLQSLIEAATPTDSSGNPVPEASYLRVARSLHTTFKDPYSSFTVQVPGIVLSFDHIVQRTDGVFVDAILGQGDALDAYSHGLQHSAVSTAQAKAAKAQLAVDLVSGHDDTGAGIYQKVFPLRPVLSRHTDAPSTTR